MRNRVYIDHSTDEISWTFNDFILGFLMIVLMMASMFAFLSNSVVVDSFINQCEDPDDPNCGAGNTLFGGRQKGAKSDKLVQLSEGSPTAGVEGGDPAELDFLAKWAGLGDVGGNSEIAFGTPELTLQKENIVFEILPDGNIIYRGETTTIEEMQKLINNIALEKGVFLEAIVHSGTPFEVYKVVRNQLWDLADAEHWRDVVQTAENKESLGKALSQYGTTYLEAAETEELRTAPRKSKDDKFFDDGFGAGFEDWVSDSFVEDSRLEDSGFAE